MTDILYQYLWNEWRENNSSKYQQYFVLWIDKLTENQIYYYNTLWLQIKQLNN